MQLHLSEYARTISTRGIYDDIEETKGQDESREWLDGFLDAKIITLLGSFVASRRQCGGMAEYIANCVPRYGAEYITNCQGSTD